MDCAAPHPGVAQSMSLSREDFTRSLAGHSPGADPSQELLSVLYDELRRLARARLRHEPPGATLGATALVHEAWLRLVGDADPGWNGRKHFFGAAALAMRRILVERARARGADKRGGGRERIELADGDALTGPRPTEFLDLDAALERFAALYPRQAQVIQLRHLAGLERSEVAELLDLSLDTVKRDQAFARAWLARELSKGGEDRPAPGPCAGRPD